ncbi:MAG: VWA domain-containing protein [Patescibacteria group bacterium]
MKKTENVVYSDRYDKRTFESIKSRAARIQELENKGLEKLPSYSPLLMDLYSILYKTDPILKSKEKVKASELINRNIIEKVMDTKQYPELRSYTYLDEFASSMAVLSLGEAVLELIPEDAKQKMQNIKSQEDNQLQGLQDQAERAQEAADWASDEAQEAADAAREAKKSNSSQASKFQQRAQQAKDRAQQMSDQAEQAQMTFEEAQQKLAEQAEAIEQELEDGAGEKMRQAIRKAAKQSRDQAEEQTETLEAWGTEPGEIQKLSYEDKMALAERLKNNKKLREIAKIVGRFRRMAIAKQKEKINSRTGVVTNVKRGNDLRRLVPAERSKFAHPSMRLDFIRRFASKQLFVFETEEKQSLGQGPVIVGIDNSGSITSEQEIWEKGLALGLYQCADYQNRHFIFIQYGGPSDPLKVIEIKKGEASYLKLLEVAEYFLGGGTDFEKPLKKAQEYIEKGLKADIVFITDGECAVSSEFLIEFNEARKKIPFNVFSVLLNIGGRTSSASLEKFSDELFNVSELTVEQAGAVFARV